MHARARVCVVGDPAQSIFGFVGASPALFSSLSARRWGDGGGGGRLTRERTISVNLRSTGRITAVANAMRGDSLRQVPKEGPGEPVTVVAVAAVASRCTHSVPPVAGQAERTSDATTNGVRA